mgnify:CR=1 FL=1
MRKGFRKMRVKRRSKCVDILIFMLLAVIGIFMALPFVYSIVQSLKPMEEIFLFPPRFFRVNHPTLDNYRMLSQLTGNLWVPFGRYLFNSIFTSVVGTAAHVLVSSMAAFVLAKNKFPGSKFLFELVVQALLFTGPVTAIPLYVIMAKAGMIDTYWVMILPAVAAPLGLFLMKQNMMQIPDAVLEAAKIDGAGTIASFVQIAMPMVKPAWMTLIIFAFQGLWNGSYSGYVYDEALKALPTVLNQISTAGISRAGVGAAVSVVLLIPPVLVFLISQSNVIETMAHSGIK